MILEFKNIFFDKRMTHADIDAKLRKDHEGLVGWSWNIHGDLTLDFGEDEAERQRIAASEEKLSATAVRA